jgi:hypothetical protein
MCIVYLAPKKRFSGGLWHNTHYIGRLWCVRQADVDYLGRNTKSELYTYSQYWCAVRTSTPSLMDWWHVNFLKRSEERDRDPPNTTGDGFQRQKRAVITDHPALGSGPHRTSKLDVSTEMMSLFEQKNGKVCRPSISVNKILNYWELGSVVASHIMIKLS